MAYENIKTYADLARTAGDMVLANEMAKRPLELVSGDCAPWDEVFQWYIISDPSFIMEHTDELVFHNEELVRFRNPLIFRVLLIGCVCFQQRSDRLFPQCFHSYLEQFFKFYAILHTLPQSCCTLSFFSGAPVTLKISSSTQSAYLPCARS